MKDPKTHRYELYCVHCGNDALFVQVMSYEAQLVNADLNYIRLLHGEVDRYECFTCGESLTSVSGT